MKQRPARFFRTGRKAVYGIDWKCIIICKVDTIQLLGFPVDFIQVFIRKTVYSNQEFIWGKGL